MGCAASLCGSNHSSNYYESEQDLEEVNLDNITCGYSNDCALDELQLHDKLVTMEGYGFGQRAPSDGSNKAEPNPTSTAVTLLVRGAKAKVACRSHELDQAELDRLCIPPPRRIVMAIVNWADEVICLLHSDLLPNVTASARTDTTITGPSPSSTPAASRSPLHPDYHEAGARGKQLRCFETGSNATADQSSVGKFASLPLVLDRLQGNYPDAESPRETPRGTKDTPRSANYAPTVTIEEVEAEREEELCRHPNMPPES